MVGRLKGELSRRRLGTDDYISSQKESITLEVEGIHTNKKGDRVYISSITKVSLIIIYLSLLQ